MMPVSLRRGVPRLLQANTTAKVRACALEEDTVMKTRTRAAAALTAAALLTSACATTTRSGSDPALSLETLKTVTQTLSSDEY